MRAAFYTQQGTARDVLQIGERPTPTPGPGEVLVKMRVSGVNPSDWKSRSGRFRAMIAPLIIPHSDGAGDIVAIGEGVDQARMHERVWIWNGQWKRAFGTAAEYVVLPSAQAVRLPDNTGYDAGACFGIPGLTAMQAVRLAEAGPGTTVLVSGGAGSVAHYAIQMARERGARVLTTISGDVKAAHARAAGAAETINYRTENVGERVKALTGGAGVDALIEMELAANAKLIPDVMKPHGRVVVYGLNAAEITMPMSWMMQNSVTLLPFLVYDLLPPGRAACERELCQLLEAGKLRHTIAARFPLQDIAAAHEAVEGGQLMGNVVLDVG